ncbi:DUF2793 domain-containing protein [Rhodobacteraceae bacterium D3-12]|nr:DUF2793 domain-containing protein [Rhodobacteraceae bacterium D3-12]
MPPSSETSPRLALPYLLPSQAQKHVTHNEALQRLDTLVQLSIQAVDAENPPVSPVAGEVHALGPVPLGVWAGEAGKLAVFNGIAWQFLAPAAGWLGYDLTTQRAIVFDGGAWVPELPDLNGLDGVGIGAEWDAVNRLSVAAQASLFSHAGSGGHQIKINKAMAGDTASLLFQSGWTGHAEMGLAGDTGFSIKISANGSSWHEALKLDPVTGETTLAPDGTVRARLSGAAFDIDVPVTGDAVQASATDATAGRLMKVGAFGLGASSASLVSDDLDNARPCGIYYSFSSCVNKFKSANGYVVDFNFDAANEYKAQLAIKQDSDLSIGFRTKHADVWGDWAELFHNENLLGTVSQSSGIPTGAVIERGSNANGEYVRFADGTQICTAKVSHDFSSTGSALYTYPAAFAATPVGGGSLVSYSSSEINEWHNGHAMAYCRNTTQWNFRVTTAQTSTLDIQLWAIGRWF